MPMRGLVAAMALMLSACGGGVALENLRCDVACQQVADPLTMALAIDYTDASGLLADGTLELTVDDAAMPSVAIASIVPGGSSDSGTLRFALPLRFRSVQNGRTFEVGVSVSTPQGTSNRVTERFVLSL
jgi:hypothetical protein